MSAERQKFALVTGASSGIGFATSVELALRGYKVFAGARRLAPMKELEKYGITLLELDVTLEKSILAAYEKIYAATEGYLDILFNNAGQSCTFPALDLKQEYFQKCYDVNVFGAMRMVRVFGPMSIKAQGLIAFTGSVSALVPFPFSSVYNSTKAAIDAYAATLSLEMSPFNVKVMNVVTGGVHTNIADTRGMPEDSIYQTDGIEIAVQARRTMAKDNLPIAPEVYAKRVVDDFVAAKKLRTYRGTKASLIGWLAIFLPSSIWNFLFIRKFKLTQVFATLRERYVNSKSFDKLKQV